MASALLEHDSLPRVEYQPLKSIDDFRLLKLKAGVERYIECELIHAKINDTKHDYEAVSYTWGLDLNADTILFHNELNDTNTSQLSVTMNLDLILRDLRYRDTDRILWIDAICINQEDIPERGSQVQRMGDIYRNASRVLYCIGHPNDMTDILFSVVQRITLHMSSNDLSFERSWDELRQPLRQEHHSLRARMRTAVDYIFKQPWFYRVWIIQEVVNAKNAWICCGKMVITPSIFARLPQLVDHAMPPHVQKILGMMPVAGPNLTHGIRTLTLYDLLRDCAGAEATDKRDKVFALLDLCSDSQAKLAIPIDYTHSEERVIRHVVEYFCGCSIAAVSEVHVDIEEFLAAFFRDSNHDTLYSAVLEQLTKSQDGVNSYILLQKHGRKISCNKRMLELAMVNPSSDVMAWCLSHQGFGSALRDLRAMAFARMPGTQDNIHAELLARLMQSLDDEVSFMRDVEDAKKLIGERPYSALISRKAYEKLMVDSCRVM